MSSAAEVAKVSLDAARCEVDALVGIGYALLALGEEVKAASAPTTVTPASRVGEALRRRDPSVH